MVNRRSDTRVFQFFFFFRCFSGVLVFFFIYFKTLAKHRRRKTPQNTRKSPQNTTKHHKTHLPGARRQTLRRQARRQTVRQAQGQAAPGRQPACRQGRRAAPGAELEVRVGLELQRAELEQQVQREEARRWLSNLQQKADQGRAQHNITANSKAGRMKPQDNVHVVVVKEAQLPILAGASRCCSCTSPSTISPT